MDNCSLSEHMTRTYILHPDTNLTGLTDKQRRIVETALEHPDWTHREIGEEADSGRSYATEVINDHTIATIEPDEIDWDDVDDELYESIYAGFEATGDVERVEQQYELQLSDDNTKEVDVAAWTNVDHHSTLIIVECKFWDDPVDLSVIAEMIANLRDSTADIGVVVSSSGFQEGAVTRAESTGIRLYTVRPIQEEDLEGRFTGYEAEVRMVEPNPRVDEIEYEPVDDDEEGLYIPDDFLQQEELYSPDRTPTGETLRERIEAEADYQDEGEYSVAFDGETIFFEGLFYRIGEVQYTVLPEDPEERSTTVREWSRDIFDLYDLVLIDELSEEEDDRYFFSIQEALEAFVDEVQNVEL